MVQSRCILASAKAAEVALNAFLCAPSWDDGTPLFFRPGDQYAPGHSPGSSVENGPIRLQLGVGRLPVIW